MTKDLPLYTKTELGHKPTRVPGLPPSPGRRMTPTDWYQPTQVPARRGWYERDHRECEYQDAKDRQIARDWWEPVANRRDILYPGVWYVFDSEGLNDAIHQQLPWRGLTESAGRVQAPFKERYEDPQRGAGDW